jgi:hypothetical protein
MPDLFADENFPVPVARQLRKLGHDVLTAGDVGISNRRIPDEIVLEFASCLDWAVLILNRADFVDLHDRGIAHGGIVVCESNSDFDALTMRVHVAITVNVSLAGRLIEVGS